VIFSSPLHVVSFISLILVMIVYYVYTGANLGAEGIVAMEL